MPLRVAPPPAWARALRACPTVAAATAAVDSGRRLLLRRLKERATPLQEAARVVRALSLGREVWRRPDVLEEGVKSFDNSRRLERCVLCSRGPLNTRFNGPSQGVSPSKSAPLQHSAIE
jgi:hypothetical protein